MCTCTPPQSLRRLAASALLALAGTQASAQHTLFKVNPADIGVELRPASAATVTTGQLVTYHLAVGNLGPSPASHVNVTLQMTNFEVTEVGGMCSALPCVLDKLEAHVTDKINVTGRAVSAGGFELAVQATAATPDPEPSNNRAVVRAVAISPSKSRPAADVPVTSGPGAPATITVGEATTYAQARERPDIWQQLVDATRQIARRLGGTAIVAALVLVGFGGAAAASVYRWRTRRRWMAMVGVSATLDRQVSFAIGPIALALPPLRIEVHLEPGEARASTPLHARPHEELT